MNTRNVLVVGGGFAGVACALELARHDIGVTLFDRNNYHQFQPMLYQVATGQVAVADVARPLRGVFRHHPNVEVVIAEVVEVDPTTYSVRTNEGATYTGDALVLAPGATANFFGVPGAAEHSFPLYTVRDAERLRLRLADHVHEKSSERLDVVVVGGGATGVESTGALVELLTAWSSEGHLSAGWQVHLADRSTALLNGFSPKAQAYAADTLAKRGVDLHLGVGIARVDPDSVELDDGATIASTLTVWAGGQSASLLAAPFGEGRVTIDEDLRVPAMPRVYVLGDAADTLDSHGNHLPALGAVAMQAGKWAGENLRAEFAGHPTKPFKYRDKGIMAMVGRNAAIAEVGPHRHQLDGPLAYGAWLGVHAELLSGVRSKSDALTSWVWDYADRDHAAIAAANQEPATVGWDDADAVDDAGEQPNIVLEASAITSKEQHV